MGQNLSLSEKFKDASNDTISEPDRLSELFLGIFWLGSAYGIGMIWCAVALLRRWAGRDGERGVSLLSVLAALLLSTGWPVILLYFAMSSG